jgi:hypothetical protein
VGRSGNHDLSIYTVNNNTVKRDVNVEFKHGNPTPENVLIDLVKLTKLKNIIFSLALVQPI